MSTMKDIIITTEISSNAIILSVEITFSEWLQAEIDRRGWTWNKLAETAGLSSGTIYNIRDGIRGVGKNSLKSIARALQLPVETVFRAAGLLPPETEKGEFSEEVLYLFEQLSPQERDEILDLLRFKAKRKSDKNTKSSSRGKTSARNVIGHIEQ